MVLGVPVGDWADAEREENNSNGLKTFGLKNGSSQGQNLALTVLSVQDGPYSRLIDVCITQL
jgi:hypothetical protein